MFHFIYKGRFDCLISKSTFEMYIQNLYYDIKKKFGVTYDPKKFTIIMEMDGTETRKGFGGVVKKIVPNYELVLFLFGYPKKEQTFELLNYFFGTVITHELFHLFIPYVIDNSCWSEGVTDFMTLWYRDTLWHRDTISEHLSKLQHEYNEITDEKYKAHKYGYITGLKKMVKLYYENSTSQISIIDDMKKIMKEFDRTKKYTAADIIAYNPKFKTFFTGRCNKHIPHDIT